MRFVELGLQTASFTTVRDFYAQVLGLELARDSPERLGFRAGRSVLTFETAAEGEPFYHFAFNVAPNRFEECFQWMAQRVKILDVEPGLPIATYPRWNAQSFYFFDPAGNVLECIVRYDLPDRRSGPFQPAKDFLEISEIGMPVRAVAEGVKRMERAGIPKFPLGPEMDVFQPMGEPDHRGLILVVEEGRPWIPTDKGAKSFSLTVHLPDMVLNLSF